MIQADQVIICGASGFVGQLIYEAFFNRGLAFTAAGRDSKAIHCALKAVADRVNVEHINAEVVQLEYSEQGLLDLFANAKVVVNTAGSVSEIGDVLVRSALAAGCHYLDVAGEQDFIFEIKEKYGVGFENKGLLLAPACAYKWVVGCLAAEVCLENDVIDSLEVTYVNDLDFSSIASVQTLMHSLANPHYYLKNHQLIAWELAQTFNVVIPGRAQVFNASSGGGGAEVIWFKDDRRVKNCKVYQCIDDNDAMQKMIEMIGAVLKDDVTAGSEGSQNIEVKLATEITQKADVINDQGTLNGVVHCTAYGAAERSSCTINVNSPDLITAELIAECGRILLEGAPNLVGLSSPAAAFGHRELLKMLADQGLLIVNEA